MGEGKEENGGMMYVEELFETKKKVMTKKCRGDNYAGKWLTVQEKYVAQ